MKKIMLLGSGELGKEFVIACKRKGQYVVACDAYEHAPAMQVADECEVFPMLDGDALMAAVKKHQPDIIVPEIEAIRTEKHQSSHSSLRTQPTQPSTMPQQPRRYGATQTARLTSS